MSNERSTLHSRSCCSYRDVGSPAKFGLQINSKGIARPIFMMHLSDSVHLYSRVGISIHVCTCPSSKIHQVYHPRQNFIYGCIRLRVYFQGNDGHFSILQGCRTSFSFFSSRSIIHIASIYSLAFKLQRIGVKF